MKTYTKEELQEILRLHQLWLNDDPNGVRANLSDADLRDADLSNTDLSSADLRYANLRFADLSSADLSSADLRYADLRFANLLSADFRYADLSSADLRFAELDKTYLVISMIGSVKRQTTYCVEDDKVCCGCFTGTMQEFYNKVLKTYPDTDNLHHKEYVGWIKYAKSLYPQIKIKI